MKGRSEEHTSELQSHDNLVCRLLLEKKNTDRGAPGAALRQPETAPHTLPEAAAWGGTREVGAPPVVGSSSRVCRLLVLFFFKNTGAPQDLPFFPPPHFPT